MMLDRAQQSTGYEQITEVMGSVWSLQLRLIKPYFLTSIQRGLQVDMVNVRFIQRQDMPLGADLHWSHHQN